MTETAFINEKTMLYHLQCPLRATGSTTVPESPVLACAENTARWLMAEQLAGRAPTVRETQEVFDQTGYFQPRSDIAPKEYARHVREGIRACHRLRDVVWRCQVLQPVSPYRLTVGGVLITGEYAVLRSSRRHKHAFVLYLRHQGIRIKPLLPDVISFARWLDLANRCTDPVKRHWGVESIGVLHYWVTRDLSAEHKPDRGFATDVLLGAVSVVRGTPFPVPGEHCKSCPHRACRPDCIEAASSAVKDERISSLPAPAANQPGL